MSGLKIPIGFSPSNAYAPSVADLQEGHEMFRETSFAMREAIKKLNRMKGGGWSSVFKVYDKKGLSDPKEFCPNGENLESEFVVGLHPKLRAGDKTDFVRMSAKAFDSLFIVAEMEVEATAKGPEPEENGQRASASSLRSWGEIERHVYSAALKLIDRRLQHEQDPDLRLCMVRDFLKKEIQGSGLAHSVGKPLGTPLDLPTPA